MAAWTPCSQGEASVELWAKVTSTVSPEVASASEAAPDEAAPEEAAAEEAAPDEAAPEEAAPLEPPQAARLVIMAIANTREINFFVILFFLQSIFSFSFLL